MLTLGALVVGTQMGLLGQAGAQLLRETASAASGDEGCAVITPPEIQALLLCLEAPSASVREAGLQVIYPGARGFSIM